MIYASTTMIMSQPSRMDVDPLSDVFTCLGAHGVRLTRLEASGAWGISFPSMPRLKFVTVLRGGCFVLSPGQQPARLATGDVLVVGSATYAVASDPDVVPVDGSALYAEAGADSVRLGGDDTVLLGGGIAFASDETRFLFEGLPAFMLIPGASPSAKPVVRILEMLAAEADQSRPGRSLVVARLGELLLVEAIRTFVDDHGGEGTGWIAALTDPRIGHALRLMHGNIAHPWTVASLAREVGMSRSAFSLRFAERVGRPPLEYLRQWRMTVARQALRAGNADIVSVAAQVGYTSQSAFGHAFKRCFGHSPRS